MKKKNEKYLLEITNYPINLDFIKQDINDRKKITLLYCDFNVCNYLYESKSNIPLSVKIYYDSFLMCLSLVLLKHKTLSKIVSTDFQNKILEFAVNNKLRIFFFGDKNNCLQKMVKNLKIQYPNILIVGINSGYEFDKKHLLNKLNIINPDILFVGLGVGRQEKWILDNYESINAQLILSVGGWFQYLAGFKKRAPAILRKFNLEWLYKLLTEFPRVWKRYLFGAPKFFYRVFISKKIKLVLNE